MSKVSYKIKLLIKVKFDMGKNTDTKKIQNINYNDPNKNSLIRNIDRLNSDFETKFDYADDLMKDFIQENPLNNETKEIVLTFLLLKEMMLSKSNEVKKIERDLKIREENLAFSLNELSIDQLEKFSDHVMKRGLEESEKNNKFNETGYKIQKIHLTYYFDELENFVDDLKINSQEKNKNEAVFLQKSQTNKNLLEAGDKSNMNDNKTALNGSKVISNNSLIMSKNYENQISMTSPNENPKNLMKQQSLYPDVNNKITSSTPSSSKTPSMNLKTQATTTSTSSNITYTKKPTGSIESIQNLNNFKNSSSAVKNPSLIDPKSISSNKSLLHSVENIKKLEEIEKTHDKLMLRGSDDLLADSGFDSDKDNREIYEKKRREKLINKQIASHNTIESVTENDQSYIGENKKKFQRSLSNLGPSLRNMKNTRSDSNNSITSTPSNKNINSTARKINRNGPEIKSNTNLDISYSKESGDKKVLDNSINQSRLSGDTNSFIKMVIKIIYEQNLDTRQEDPID